MNINWNDLASKAWHTALVLGSAYAATDPRVAWVIPVITALASASKSPLPAPVAVEPPA